MVLRSTLMRMQALLMSSTVALGSCGDEAPKPPREADRAGDGAEPAGTEGTNAKPPAPALRDPMLAGPAYLATASQVFLIEADGTTGVVFEAPGIVELEVEATGDALVTSDRGLTRITGRAASALASSTPADAFNFAVSAGDEVWALTAESPYQLDGANWVRRPIEASATGKPISCRDIAMDAKGAVWVAAGSLGLFEWNGDEWRKFAKLNGRALHAAPAAGDGVYVLTDRGYVHVASGGVSEVFSRDDVSAFTSEITRNGVWMMVANSSAGGQSFVLGKGAASHWEANAATLGADSTWFTVDASERIWGAGRRTVTIAKKDSDPVQLALRAGVPGALLAVEVVGSGPARLPADIGPSASMPGAPGGGAASADVSAPSPKHATSMMGGSSVSGGSVSSAGSIVGNMAPAFRRCYNRGLLKDPNMKGSVRVTAKLGLNGEVVSATPTGGTGLSKSVISCVVSRVEAAQFAPPEGGAATIVIPVSFVQK